MNKILNRRLMTMFLKNTKKTLNKLTVFDYLTIFLVTIVIVFLGVFFFRKQKTVEVWIKVSPKDIWWEKKPPYWLLSNLKIGDYEVDSLGRKAAEIVDVKVYERGGIDSDAYLKLKLRVTEDKRKDKYTFKSKQVEIGTPVELQFPRIFITGIITDIEGMTNNLLKDQTVEVSLTSNRANYPGTNGVDAWIAEAVRVGDKMKDNQGNIIAEILSKKVKPADHVVTTSDGRIFIKQDPLLKNVVMTIRIKTSDQLGVDYFLYDQKVKVGNVIFVSLPDIDLFTVITKLI